MSNRAHRRARSAHRSSSTTDGQYVATPTGGYEAMRRFADLDPKIGTRHRWIATAGYVLTDGQATAAFSGARINLPVERLFTFGVGCVDCELEYDDALALEPCAAEEWSRHGVTVPNADGDPVDITPIGGHPGERAADPRIVYGARCFWWNGIAAAGSTSSGLPACPYCGSPLFEAPNEAAWWKGNAEAVAEGRAPDGYLNLLRWSRGKCFPNPEAALSAMLDDEVF